MKKFTYLFLIILFALPTFAKKVEIEAAKKAAKNLYYTRINQVKSVDLSRIGLELVYTEVVDNEPVYYVFNVNETEGFVIISANDIAKPCIGYSFEGSFNPSNQPSEFQFYMSGFRDQIANAVTTKSTASIEATKQWADLLSETPAITKSKSIQPLLLTAWDQVFPFNEQCPLDAAGPSGHVLVGCVAISTSQIMKYYNYPNQGVGSHTNYSVWNGGYGNITINFGNQTYNWANMPNTATVSSPDMAKLLYHVGVAVDMNWGPDGSGATTSKVVTALETWFKYSTNCQYVQRTSYSTTAWEAMIRDQIDNKWPIIYQGRTAAGDGHAWNCDGYNATEFHMNWGWGGSANGFYAIDNLVAGGYDFSTEHGAVINIYPAANYPEGCSTTAKVINGTSGAFNDGSGNQNYLDSQDCLYLIQPTCASFVSLSFDRFDLGTGDQVIIYDGATTSSPVLATYSASALPTASVASTGASMLIEFLTDGSSNATGWYASYTTYPCIGTKNLTDPSGSVSDGSNSCDYKNSVVCTWNIQPAGATAFSLTFPEFSFAAGDAGDNLKVYKTNTTSGNLIGTYNASNLPPSPLTISGTGKVILRFQTNSSASAAGWTCEWNATLTGIENNLAEFNAGIYPNPFQSDATVSYTLSENTQVKITVNNILGETLGTYDQLDSQGAHLVQLSSFAENLSQGMYFVNLSFNDKTTSIKVICSK